MKDLFETLWMKSFLLSLPFGSAAAHSDTCTVCALPTGAPLSGWELAESWRKSNSFGECPNLTVLLFKWISTSQCPAFQPFQSSALHFTSLFGALCQRRAVSVSYSTVQ